MKKSEAIQKIKTICKVKTLERAEEILNELLTFMRPPSQTGENAQAIIGVYMGASLSMWDEDFEKDEKLVQYRQRRAAAKIERSTAEGRAAMRARLEANRNRKP